jgi:hypothetical protein
LRFADLRFDLTGDHGFSASWIDHLLIPDPRGRSSYVPVRLEQYAAGTFVSASGQFSYDMPAATLDGTTYPSGSVLIGAVVSSIAFLPTVLPEVPFNIMDRFRWEGTLGPRPDVPPGSVLATLRGTGTVTLDFVPGTTSGQARLTGLQYEFDSHTPIPEPATIFLFAGGLIVLISRYRRREQML